MADIAEIGFRVDTSGLRRARDELNRLKGGQTTFRQETERATRETGRLRAGIGLLTTGFVALGGAMAARQLLGAADTFRLMDRQVSQFTDSVEETNAVMNRLFELSQRNRQSFEATAAVYNRFAIATDDLGLSSDELFQIVSGLQETLVLSGASAQEAQSGMIQLAQGMASGRLQGEELRAVLESMPLLAREIASVAGVPFGELRDAAAEGLIQVEEVVQALKNMDERLDIAGTSVTFGEAMTQMQNAVVLLAGELNEATDATGFFAGAISRLAETVSEHAEAINLAQTVTVDFADAVFSSERLLDSSANAMARANQATEGLSRSLEDLTDEQQELIRTDASVAMEALENQVRRLELGINQALPGLSEIRYRMALIGEENPAQPILALAEAYDLGTITAAQFSEGLSQADAALVDEWLPNIREYLEQLVSTNSATAEWQEVLSYLSPQLEETADNTDLLEQKQKALNRALREQQRLRERGAGTIESLQQEVALLEAKVQQDEARVIELERQFELEALIEGLNEKQTEEINELLERRNILQDQLELQRATQSEINVELAGQALEIEAATARQSELTSEARRTAAARREAAAAAREESERSFQGSPPGFIHQSGGRTYGPGGGASQVRPVQRDDQGRVTVIQFLNGRQSGNYSQRPEDIEFYYGADRRAVGGPVQPGRPYLVGEAGPELFVPSSAGTIRPNHTTNNASSTTSVIINVNGTPDPVATAQEVRRVFQEQARRGNAALTEDMVRGSRVRRVG